MKHAIFLALFFVFTCFVCSVWSQSATNVSNEGGSNCTPINCQAVCSPGCTTNTTCVLGTMKVCGVCPSSLCIDNSLLGLPMAPGDSSSGGTNGDDGAATAANTGDNLGMIGGVIGGLIGGGLLLVAAGLVFMFWHKKQNSNKTISGHTPPLSQKNHTTSVSSMSNTGLSASPRNLSTLIGPTLPVSRNQQKQGHTVQASLNQKQATSPPPPTTTTATATTTTNRRANDNDMDDGDDDDDDDDGRSSVSSVSYHGLASMVMVSGQQQEGLLGSRLKPQIMRLSTVRASLINASLNHNGTSSVRTILTPTTMPLPKSVQCSTNNHDSISNNNISSSTVSSPLSTIGTTSLGPSLKTAAETTNNPFDDQHCVIDR